MPKKPKNESRIRELRRIIGMSQVDFANLLDLNPGTYQNIELGRHPLMPETLKHIAMKTGCDLDFGPNYSGKSGWGVVDGKIVQLDPVDITLTCRFTGNPFTKTHFERRQQSIIAISKIQSMAKASGVLIEMIVDNGIGCSSFAHPSEVKDNLYPLLEGVVDGAVTAASCYLLGIDELVEHLRNEQWWGIEWDKYLQDYDPKKALRSALLDMVADVDFKVLSKLPLALASLRDDPGGTSPQN